jgi:hypothetical protein
MSYVGGASGPGSRPAMAPACRRPLARHPTPNIGLLGHSAKA